jgi:hypothetical protein
MKPIKDSAGTVAGGQREGMHSVIISAAVGLLAFAMGLVGLYLKRLLPERHMSMGSRDMIGPTGRFQFPF